MADRREDTTPFTSTFVVAVFGAWHNRFADWCLPAPQFRLALARKDTDLMVTAADLAGGVLPLLQSVRFWLLKAESEGRGDVDYTALLAAMTDHGGCRAY